MTQGGETKFKEDLKNYFPDLYKFWSLFAFDHHYKSLLDGVVDAVDSNMYGNITITYQNGKINYINITKQLTAHKSNKPTKRLTDRR